MSPPARRPSKTYGRNFRARFPVFRDQEIVSEEDVRLNQKNVRETTLLSIGVSADPLSVIGGGNSNRELVNKPLGNINAVLNTLETGPDSKTSKRTALSNKTSNTKSANINSRSNPETPTSHKFHPLPSSPPRKSKKISLLFQETTSPLERRTRRRIHSTSLEDQDYPSLLNTPKSNSSTSFLFSMDLRNKSPIVDVQQSPKFSKQLGNARTSGLVDTLMEPEKFVQNPTNAAAHFPPAMRKVKTPKKSKGEANVKMVINMGRTPYRRISSPGQAYYYDEVIESTDYETQKADPIKSSLRQKRLLSNLSIKATKRLKDSLCSDGESNGNVANKHKLLSRPVEEAMINNGSMITATPAVTASKRPPLTPRAPKRPQMMGAKLYSDFLVTKHEDGFDADAEMCTEDENNTEPDVSSDECESIKYRSGAVWEVENKDENNPICDPICHDFDFDKDCDYGLASRYHNADDGPLRNPAVVETGVTWTPKNKRVSKIIKGQSRMMDYSSDELASNRYSIVAPSLKVISPDRKTNHNDNGRTKKARLMTAAEKIQNDSFNLRYEPEHMEIDELQWNTSGYHV